MGPGREASILLCSEVGNKDGGTRAAGATSISQLPLVLLQ